MTSLAQSSDSHETCKGASFNVESSSSDLASKQRVDDDDDDDIGAREVDAEQSTTPTDRRLSLTKTSSWDQGSISSIDDPKPSTSRATDDSNESLNPKHPLQTGERHFRRLGAVSSASSPEINNVKRESVVHLTKGVGSGGETATAVSLIRGRGLLKLDSGPSTGHPKNILMRKSMKKQVTRPERPRSMHYSLKETKSKHTKSPKEEVFSKTPPPAEITVTTPSGGTPKEALPGLSLCAGCEEEGPSGIAGGEGERGDPTPSAGAASASGSGRYDSQSGCGLAGSSLLSYSRAVPSDGDSGVTVTVSDTSSQDSPLLSPHHYHHQRPLLHPHHHQLPSTSASSSPSSSYYSSRHQDAKYIKVDIVDANNGNMELDSGGGRFERRTTILDSHVTSSTEAPSKTLNHDKPPPSAHQSGPRKAPQTIPGLALSNCEGLAHQESSPSAKRDSGGAVPLQDVQAGTSVIPLTQTYLTYHGQLHHPPSTLASLDLPLSNRSYLITLGKTSSVTFTYTSDMVVGLENKIVLVADDATLVGVVKSPLMRNEAALDLSSDMDRISKWCSGWGIRLWVSPSARDLSLWSMAAWL
ncbi:uncharacterized protein [Macrobrachium rosenbergii]|uniref:uncharacterized protein n=1 Tax=Macrobrachium rosenbergii TaxID=79674 RepID=UPI0034D77464